MKQGSMITGIRFFFSTMLLIAGLGSVINSSSSLRAADCTPPPSGLVAWWPAEGSAVDSIGGNNGTNQNISYATGKVGQSFVFNGTTNGIAVPASAALNVSQQGAGGLTIETWVNPANLNNLNEWLAGWRNGDSSYGTHIKLSQAPSAGTGAGCIVANLVDTSGGGHLLSSAPVLVTNVFQHVALTYNQSNGIGVIYVNGAIVAQSNLGSFTPQTSYSFQLGLRASGGNFGENSFGGKIDELSLYNRPLGSNEIQAIYNAGTAGKCAPVVSGCTPSPSGLVGWWPAEGNAVDLAGTNNGTIVNGVTFANGKVGQGFRLDGTNGYVQIPDAVALKPTNVTVEAWVWLDPNINTATNPRLEFIIFKKNSWDFLFEGYSLLKESRPNGDGTYTERFSFVVSSGGNQVITYSTSAIQRGAWNHVAGTYDGNRLTLWVNGVAEASANAGFALDYGTLPVFIGTSGQPDPYNGKLAGIIDEPSIYNRALSTNEIAAIYNAGTAGKCFTPAPPVITQQPTSKSAVVGDSLTFSVNATGTAPLAYQWYFNNGPLNKATNSSLVLTNVQIPQQGNYSVVVSNFAGFTISSNALLTVTTPTCTTPPSGLVGWWQAEGNANDSIGTNNGTLVGGASYVLGKVGQSFMVDGLSQFISVPDNKALNPTNAITIECWVKASRFPVGAGDIISKDGETSARQYLLALDPGSSHFRAHVGVPSGFLNFNGSTVVQTNTWYHVAMSFDGSKLKLFVNGQPDGSLSVTGPLITTTQPLRIGGGAPAGQLQYFFPGQIDEVSLYNRALNTNEILAIYNAGSLGKCFTPAPPVITQQPASKNAVVGDSLTFSVNATGASPLNYQWRFNGNSINGKTNSSLSLTNVQLSQQGNYSVIVSNFISFTTSSNALLTVTTPVCTPPPSGLVGWWPAEGNGNDNLGGNNGSLIGGASFITGKVGQAFLLSTTNAGVKVPASPALDVGLGGGFTVEGWINPSNLSIRGEIAEWNNGDTNQVVPYGVHLQILGPGELGLGAGNLFSDVHGADGQVHWIMAPGGTLQTNTFQHVALTYDKGTGIAKLYRSGLIVAQQNLGSFTPLTSSDFYIGRRPAGLGSVHSFSGRIDELSLYNRALSTNEILAIYNAGTAGKCFTPAPPVITQQPTNKSAVVGDSLTFSVNATGTPPLAYQWYFNNSPLNGATNISLSLTNVQLSQQGNYSVIVSNFVSFTTSSNALLTVTTPVCTPPPSGLVGWWPAEGNGSDAVGTNNVTTPAFASYTTGKVGLGFNFGGTNALTVPNSPSLNPTSQLTLECWIYVRARAPFTWSQNVFGKDGDCHGNREYKLIVGDSPTQAGAGDFRAHIGVPSGFQTVDGVTVIQSNTWYHVAETYDGTTLKLYVNGNLDGQLAVTGPIVSTSEPIRLGGGPDGCYSYYYFDGILDEPTLYNRALGSNEIAAIYNARGAGKCPVPPIVLDVTPTNWFVNEGTTVSYTVTAAGSPVLTYQWQYGGSDIIGATNATLTLSNVVYAQAGSYTVVVSNPAGMASTNVLLQVNRAPIADASATETLLISPNNTNALAVLDGSHSSDPDGDTLTYGWFHTGDVSPFATNVVAIETLPVGTNQLTLTVSDGMASGSQEFAVEVITTSQAVERLINLVQSGSGKTQPLIASLRAALAAIDRSQPATAINQLEAFINKVHAQLEPVDPTLAAQLIADAQAIIDALNGGSPVVATKVEISNISHGHNGKSHLKVKGTAGHVYIIETSTDMVHWVPVGVAAQGTDGDYQFDDSTQDAAARFYRVVSPK